MCFILGRLTDRTGSSKCDLDAVLSPSLVKRTGAGSPGRMIYNAYVPEPASHSAHRQPLGGLAEYHGPGIRTSAGLPKIETLIPAREAIAGIEEVLIEDAL